MQSTLVEQIPAITYVASLDDNRATVYISPQVHDLVEGSGSRRSADGHRRRGARPIGIEQPPLEDDPHRVLVAHECEACDPEARELRHLVIALRHQSQTEILIAKAAHAVGDGGQHLQIFFAA